jgi:hypothetical protein
LSNSCGCPLLSHNTKRRETIFLPPGETREKDFSWFDWTNVRQLSPDGKILLFEEQGASARPNYNIFIRKTDGSAAIKLGEGYAFGLSRDGNYVISQLPGDYSKGKWGCVSTVEICKSDWPLACTLYAQKP